METARARGEQELDRSMARLAEKASRLVSGVREYKSRCGGPLEPLTCDGLRERLTQLAIEVGSELEAVEDEARRSWLEPGKVREIREKYGLDDNGWDQLSRLVRQYRR